ncbi:MAG TPA: transposase [Balneolaceae bacterium]
MARSRYKIYEEEYPYFITSSINSGLPLFGIPKAADIVLNSLEFLRTERDVKVIAYVIMEDHFHAILQGRNLAVKIGSFKSFTAHEIINLFQQMGRKRILTRLRKSKKTHKIDQVHQLWQEGFHPKQIVSDNMMIQKIEYIHANPVKKGYVDEVIHWRYSSARNYFGMGGIIPVDLYQGRGAPR